MRYMDSITHREMRNNSAEVLRRVEAGESLQVSNHGRPAALIVPVGNDPLDASIAAEPPARPARAWLRSRRFGGPPPPCRRQQLSRMYADRW